MQVTNITVTRARKVQPEQYGSADASVTLVANINEGEDWKKVADSLLTDARTLVYENLGLKLPARASGGAVKQDTATVETNVDVAAAKSSDVPDEKPAETAPKRRGRPPKAQNKVPADLTADVPDDDVPGDDTKLNIQNNPEDRRNPDDDIPGDESDQVEDEFSEVEAAAETTMSASDLQSYLTECVKNKKVTATRVREIIASYGVARTSDLPADKVAAVKAKIDAEIG